MKAKPIRVLVVDDEEKFGLAMTALLAEDERVTVVGTARRGRDAIEQAAAGQVDVVLMDIGLPDVDGLEVARRLRASRPQTEVIVVSAYDPADYASPARAAGAAAFVMKGGIGSELAETIAAVAAGVELL